jgi:uncharacterized protein (TIGR03000 family)
MYSVVLLAALTAGTSTPSWGWGKGDHNGWGGKHGSHGASGSSLCYGCYGGYGSYGWYNGCYGGPGALCWGAYAFGSYGFGSTYAAGRHGAASYGAGCYGAGCAGCWGGTAYPPSQVTQPAGASGTPAPEAVPAPKKEEQKTTALGEARLIVSLPVDAKLYVDDKLTTAISERRVFNTPGLSDGQEYYYILRAELVRDGKTRSKTKRVLLHAGDFIETSFAELEDLVRVRAEASDRW